MFKTADLYVCGLYLLSTYGLPLSVTFVRPGLNSCVLHSTCRWLQLPPVGDYSPLLYRLHIHPASVRLPGAQSLHLHGGATAQRVFGQTSKCSVLLSSTCRASALLLLLRSFPAYPLCGRCACSWRIGIDWHLC